MRFIRDFIDLGSSCKYPIEEKYGVKILTWR